MTESLSDRIRNAIRTVPDFPKPGIQFRDITTVLAEPELFRESLEGLFAPFAGRTDLIVGIESRGFILGSSIAVQHGLPFVPMRKPGKLPAAKYREEYVLEYGTDALEVHQDAIPKGSRVLIIDDLLATGGTALASQLLVEKAGGELVGFGFLIELDGLGGRKRLGDSEIFSLLHYE